MRESLAVLGQNNWGFSWIFSVIQGEFLNYISSLIQSTAACIHVPWYSLFTCYLMLFNGVMLPATACHGKVVSNAHSYAGGPGFKSWPVLGQNDWGFSWIFSVIPGEFLNYITTLIQSTAASIHVPCYSLFTCYLSQQWELHNPKCWHHHHINKKNLHGLSPWANYTGRATAACRRSDCQIFLWIEGATWSAWRILMTVFSVF
jgi:hypothetical protein